MSKYYLDVDEVNSIISAIRSINSELDVVSRKLVTDPWYVLNKQNFPGRIEYQDRIIADGKVYDRHYDDGEGKREHSLTELIKLLQTVITETQAADIDAKNKFAQDMNASSTSSNSMNAHPVNSNPAYHVDVATYYTNTSDHNPYGRMKLTNGGYTEVFTNNYPNNVISNPVSCTYFTMRKLAERGLAYPAKSNVGNGGNWYNAFDEKSGLLNADGNMALEQICENANFPIKNIVVSFSKSGYLDKDGSDCGHVLLIDEMYMDESGEIKVNFTDTYNYKTNNYIGYDDKNPDSFNTGAVMTYSLNEFKRIYKYPLSGAVVVGE